MAHSLTQTPFIQLDQGRKIIPHVQFEFQAFVGSLNFISVHSILHKTGNIRGRHVQLQVARFYLLREQGRGARIHLANVVLAFPGTPAAEEARTELETRGWDVSLHSLDTLQGRIDG